jgi:hypothetical protein
MLPEDLQVRLQDWTHTKLAQEIDQQERQQDLIERVGEEIDRWNVAVEALDA